MVHKQSRNFMLVVVLFMIFIMQSVHVTAQGTYEGVEAGEQGITDFQICMYKSFPLVVCNVLNEKNETTKEHETKSYI